MPPKSLVGHRSSGPVASHQNGRGGVAMAISARHQLLSDSWTSDVEKLEHAIGRSTPTGTWRTTAKSCFSRSPATNTST